MKTFRRMLAALLALMLLIPSVFAEEDEDDDYVLIEDYLFDDEGNIILPDEDDADVLAQFDFDSAEMEAISQLDEMEIDETVDPGKLDINPYLPDHVVNILLVGIDTRSTTMDDGLQHGDVQIILSVNKKTGDVKLSSIMRDLYLTIPGYKSKNRANIAYARGGGALAMRTINNNFDMNIQYYATINFYGLASIIDSIGGIDIEMTKVEAKAVNTYLKKHPPKYDNTDGKSRTPLPGTAGVHHCDGVQAVMYARLREIDNDFARTARQRKLLELLLKKVMQDMDPGKLINLVQSCLPYVITNMSGSAMFDLALSVLNSGIINKVKTGEPLMEQMRIPIDDTWKYDTTEGGASVIVFRTTKRKTENVKALHEFIYGDYYPAD